MTERVEAEARRMRGRIVMLVDNGVSRRLTRAEDSPVSGRGRLGGRSYSAARRTTSRGAGAIGAARVEFARRANAARRSDDMNFGAAGCWPPSPIHRPESPSTACRPCGRGRVDVLVRRAQLHQRPAAPLVGGMLNEPGGP